MRCPSCEMSVEEGAWICPFCDHILDSSFLEDSTARERGDPSSDDLPAAREERTKLVAWPKPTENDEIPDAMILGDVSVDENEFSVVHGAGAKRDGRTSTFLYYASGATTRVVHPDAVPRVTTAESTIPRTPYEDFILSCVDGHRSVREIQKASGLAPQEVVVTLLTLLDKGAVVIETASGEPGASRDLSVSGGGPEHIGKRAKKKKKKKKPVGERPPVIPQPLSEAEEVATHLGAPPLLPAQSPWVGTDARASAPIPMAPSRRLDDVSGPVPDDFEDLPSVSDFEEIGEAEPRPARKRRKRSSSIDNVWSDAPQSGVDASGLIEEEAPAVVPTDLDETDEEIVTAAVLAPAPRKASPVAPRPPPAPPRSEPPVVRSTPAERADTKPPKHRAHTPPPPVPPATPPPRVAPPKRRATTPKPFELDPAFLVEVPPSSVMKAMPLGLHDDDESPRLAPAVSGVGAAAPEPVDAEQIREQRKAALAAAAKRGPIQERIRRGDERRAGAAKRRADPSPMVTPARPEPRADDRPNRKPREVAPVDSVRMLKAQKLFDQALKDKADGNLVSARMNMKLALTFDPTNELYEQAFDELSKNPDAKPSSEAGGGRSKARDLYDAATDAENAGDVDRAIELLEKALDEAKQPAFFNRLGVLLAMKKHDFGRAQSLIEQAIDLAPGNGTYEKNLQKILSMAATMDVARDDAGGKKGGLLGFLGRRR